MPLMILTIPLIVPPLEDPMPLATSTSTLPQMLMASLTQCSECGEGSSDVSHYLDRLYMPHGKYARFFGPKLRCLGKGVMLRGEIFSKASLDLSDFSSSRK